MRLADADTALTSNLSSSSSAHHQRNRPHLASQTCLNRKKHPSDWHDCSKFIGAVLTAMRRQLEHTYIKWYDFNFHNSAAFSLPLAK